MQISGKRVLLTGASRGIGETLAERFARAGASLALVARSEGPLKELAARLGGTPHPLDLCDSSAVAGLIERVEAEAGPVDIVINNAGVSLIDYFLHHSADDVEAIFRTNLLAPVEICRQAIPPMLKRGEGHIVNISSIAGVLCPPGLVHYGASKAGLSHYTACLRNELQGLPIGTTLVELGSVPTEMDDSTQDYAPYVEFREKRNPRFDPDRDRVPRETVADAIVDAIENNRRHVRLPRMLAPLCATAEATRRISEFLFRGIDVRGGANPTGERSS